MPGDLSSSAGSFSAGYADLPSRLLPFPLTASGKDPVDGFYHVGRETIDELHRFHVLMNLLDAARAGNDGTHPRVLGRKSMSF